MSFPVVCPPTVCLPFICWRAQLYQGMLPSIEACVAKKKENSRRREIILPFPLEGTINEAESFRRTFAALNNAEGGEFVPGYRSGNFQFR